MSKKRQSKPVNTELEHDDDAESVTSVVSTIDTTADIGDVLAIVGGYHGAPHDVLGIHPLLQEGASEPTMVIRAFRPLDARVFVLDLTDNTRTEMTRVDEAGFFEAIFPQRDEPFPYRLIVADKAGQEYELEDPYRFPPMLTDLRYLPAQ